MIAHPHPWLRRFRARPRARIRLVCFPHAGGAAAYFRAWSQQVPDSVEVLVVQYPGHGDRLDEPLLDAIDPVAGAVVDALGEVCPGPTALFGHSLGAAVAYEVAARLETAGRPLVLPMFASGRPSPLQPGTRHAASDDELWADVVGLGGTEPELLANPVVREMSLPRLRNDYRLSETYQPSPGGQISAPVRVYYGADDPEIPSAAAIDWARWTTGPCTVRRFGGDHFYLAEHRSQLLADIGAQLGSGSAVSDAALP